MEPKITFAKDKATSEFVRIENAANGDKCNGICYQCEKDLRAIQGKEIKWHFRHVVETDCQGGFETAIHYGAKQILEASLFVKLHDGRVFNYENTLKEKSISSFRPDIQLVNDQETLLIEIKVEHGISDEKLLKIKEYNKRVIEINLSEVSREITYEELKELVLNETNNKSLIHTPTVPQKDELFPTWLKIAFGFFVGWIIYSLLFPKRRFSIR
jgi:hypothetical protein